MNAPQLDLVLTARDDGLGVWYRLGPIVLAAGDLLAEQPVTVAGIPTCSLRDGEFTAADDHGGLPLTLATVHDHAAGGPVRRWTVDRPTSGDVEVRYVAPYRTVDKDTAAGHPPLDLRREAGCVTGTGITFLILPPPLARLRLTLQWRTPDGAGLDGVSSLGTGDAVAAGTTDDLRQSHYMAGELRDNSETCSDVAVWWLTRPPFDVRAFAQRIARLHEGFAHSFGGPRRELRVFLRCNPYPGFSAAALRSSFVVGYDSGRPDAGTRMDHLLAHELVHGWVHLDGETGSVAWFNEGVADYFAAVVPLRYGILGRDAFLEQVNLAARHCHANLYRELSMAEVIPLTWTDIRAQRLLYGRGMFYFADLDARLARGVPGTGIGTLVKRVTAMQRSGRQVGVEEWLDMVSAFTGADEAYHLESMVFKPGGRPREDAWGPQFECSTVDVPVINPGFAPSTFATGRVTELTPGGPAAVAGLVEGDRIVGMPRYEDLVRLPPGQPFAVSVRRGGQDMSLTMVCTRDLVQVPVWR